MNNTRKSGQGLTSLKLYLLLFYDEISAIEWQWKYLFVHVQVFSLRLNSLPREAVEHSW